MCHEVTDRKKRYSCTISLILALRCGWVVNATPKPLYPWEKTAVPIAEEAGWAPGLPNWYGNENISFSNRGSNLGPSGL